MPTTSTAKKTATRKAPARKATPAAKAPTKKAAPRKAKAPVPTPEALADAALTVANHRADLDAAIAHRNRLMVQAKAAGMSVAAIGRAAGFASTGGAQVAIAAGEAAQG